MLSIRKNIKSLLILNEYLGKIRFKILIIEYNLVYSRCKIKYNEAWFTSAIPEITPCYAYLDELYNLEIWLKQNRVQI